MPPESCARLYGSGFQAGRHAFLLRLTIIYAFFRFEFQRVLRRHYAAAFGHISKIAAPSPFAAAFAISQRRQDGSQALISSFHFTPRGLRGESPRRCLRTGAAVILALLPAIALPVLIRLHTLPDRHTLIFFTVRRPSSHFTLSRRRDRHRVCRHTVPQQVLPFLRHFISRCPPPLLPPRRFDAYAMMRCHHAMPATRAFRPLAPDFALRCPPPRADARQSPCFFLPHHRAPPLCSSISTLMAIVRDAAFRHEDRQ